MMKKITILAIILISFGTAFGQKNKPVKLTLNTPKLDVHYYLLAYYYGDTKYKVDSVVISNHKSVYVDDSNKLKGGIYLVIFPEKGNNYFEMIISGNEKNIEITIPDSNIQKPTFKNSEENAVFYDDIAKLMPAFGEINSLKSQYEKAKSDSEKKAVESKLDAIEKSMKDRRAAIVKAHPTLFYSNILNMMKEIDVPEPPKKADGTVDSTFKYFYFKDHYWDYTDFNDDRLLYTPVFVNKFKYFFDKLIIKHPDSIKREMDFVLAKIKNPNSNMMKYVLATLLNDYANSKIMGQDELYVYLVKNYYSKGKAPWVDSAQLKSMQYDAADLEPVLIGKTAPDFAVFDTTLVNYSRLYDMKSNYKVLVFWNPDCGHCKKEIPVLDSIYPSLVKEGADVFAVSTIVDQNNEINDWKNFITSHKLKFKNYADPRHQMNPMYRVLYKIKGTPEYYILDKNNRIIAKKLGPTQMVDFLQNYKKSRSN